MKAAGPRLKPHGGDVGKHRWEAVEDAGDGCREQRAEGQRAELARHGVADAVESAPMEGHFTAVAADSRQYSSHICRSR